MAFSFEDIRSQFRRVSETMNQNKELLTELDSAIGDGDLGLTMSTGFSAVVESLEQDDGQDIGKALMRAGMAMNNAASSTMGTLISSALLRMGQATKGKSEIDDATFVQVLKAGVQGIKDRGKADVGDKTILDALVPAVTALAETVEKGVDLPEALQKAALAAEAGYDATEDMVSKFGRGHYYGEKSRGNKDPGAAVGMLVFRALRDAVCS